MIEVLYFSDHIVFEVQRLQVDILLKTIDAIDHLVVKVQFLVHLRVLVQTIILTNYLQILVVENQASFLCSLEIGCHPWDSQSLPQCLVRNIESLLLLVKCLFLHFII